MITIILLVLAGLVLLIVGGALALIIGAVNMFPGANRASGTVAFAVMLAGVALLFFAVTRAF